MPYKASFVTGYLQREIPVDAALIHGDGLAVGDLVKYVPATATTVAYVVPVTSNDATAALEEATHIIAQSDMSLEYGHIPVEYCDHRYSPIVKCTVTPGTAGAHVHGVCDTVANLSTKYPAAAVNDVAYVLADGKVYKKGSSSWSVDSAATVEVKKMALFAITDKQDIIVKA